MVLHGSNHVTLDCDLAIASTDENTSAIVRALSEFNPLPVYWRPGTAFVWDERRFFGTNVRLKTSVGDLDLILDLPGVQSYEAMRNRCVSLEIGGQPVRVASIDDLIGMKSVAGRIKDQLHLLELEELKKLGDGD